VRNEDIAKKILDGSSYVVLATADADGVPWATPVWFATEDYRRLYWVSAPEARHSRNIAVRPEIGMVVYDSTVAPLNGQAVYMSGIAAQVDEGLEVYSRVSVRSGLAEWGEERVSGESRLRLYRADVTEHSILDPDASVEVRVAVSL
jgi:nitroimidazol reductase NimA-like FMN-containing flavoprotein (pyridoxamine 5'-phosphate oxidase superfamily)